jgi:hypothetical protein
VNAGIAVSQDRGDHWTVRRGLDCNVIEHLWVVPADPPVLYATGEAPDTGCVLQDPDYCATGRSADQGVTWSCQSLPADSQLIAVDPLSAALYARHFPAGLTRSVDGGATFVPVVGARRADVLAFDPHHAGVAYAGTDLGVARSADGGASWTRLAFPVTEPVVALALGPEDPAAVYAATLTNLYRSSDGGGTWTAVGSGLGEVAINAILIDPDDPSTLYLATTGGSVMRLRQTG